MTQRFSIPRLPSSVEVSTETKKELEVSFRDDLDIGMDAGCPRVSFCEENLREIEESLFSETPSHGPHGKKKERHRPGGQGLVH